MTVRMPATAGKQITVARTSAKAGLRAVVETKGTALKTRAAGMLLTKEMLSEVGTPATAWKYQNSGGTL